MSTIRKLAAIRTPIKWVSLTAGVTLYGVVALAVLPYVWLQQAVAAEPSSEEMDLLDD